MKKLLLLITVFAIYWYDCCGMETIKSEPSQQAVNLENLFKEQTKFFSTFPPNYQTIIQNFVKENRSLSPKVQKELANPKLLPQEKANIVAWAAIADARGLRVSLKKGYLHFHNGKKKFFKGKKPLASEFKLSEFVNHEYNEQFCLEQYKMSCQEAKKTFVQFYKIHLMPKPEEFNAVVLTLLDRLEKDPKLQESLSSFKIFKNPRYIKVCLSKKLESCEILPTIVLYPALGKDAAQYVLNAVTEVFGRREGVDVTPRFNRKITSLIYYAQGSGGEKKESTQQYFEPDFVHYKADFTGKSENYQLTSPFAMQETSGTKRKEPEEETSIH